MDGDFVLCISSLLGAGKDPTDGHSYILSMEFRVCFKSVAILLGRGVRSHLSQVIGNLDFCTLSIKTQYKH